MKHNTSELTGALLDAAVAKACGLTVDSRNHMLSVTGPSGVFVGHIPPCVFLPHWSPSTQWADGGPLKESEQIATWHCEDTNDWRAHHPDDDSGHYGTASIDMHELNGMRGATELEAAMRALVAAKLGGEVELP